MKYKVLLLTALLGISTLSSNACTIDSEDPYTYLDCGYYPDAVIINLHYENDGKTVKLVQPKNSFHYKKGK